jgi:protoporphyrinogen oxidase
MFRPEDCTVASAPSRQVSRNSQTPIAVRHGNEPAKEELLDQRTAQTLSAGVIGGGVSGLASALRLGRLGHRVTLLEAEDFLGGLGTTFPYREGHLEKFYHCILPDDEALIRLIHDVGLGDDLLWRETAMGFMYRRRIYPMNTPMDLLRFSPLSVLDRMRMGWMGLRARNGGLNPALDDIAAEDWVRKLAGDRAFEILWKPMLEAKIGDSYPALPALWLSSRMNREKSASKEMKGCLKRGYRSLIDALESALRAAGVEIRYRVKVAAIERDGEQMALRYDDGKRESFDLVVSTTPLVHFQAMTRGLDLDPALANLKLDYQGVVCGVFLLEKPLSHYYWMPVVDSGAHAQGVVEMSNLVPLERSGGLYVTYLLNYTHRNSPLFARSDAEILEMYRSDLASLFPDAGRTIVDQFVFRAPFVEPIWTLGYRRLSPPTSVIPGRLYLSCTAQVYPRVNSWNSCCTVVESMIPGLERETGSALARSA